jgi:nucleoside-diphosphate-sugar epimerase
MRVIITGAAGQIGREMVDELSDSHELRLIDRSPVPGRVSCVADLASLRATSGWLRRFGSRSGQWTELFEGADAVLHLAAEPSPMAIWKQVLHDNIQATCNVIDVAARLRIRRVVYASSVLAVEALERELAPACYSADGPKIGSEVSPRPLTPYGVSKATGELIGRMFVDGGKLASFLAVRIGHYQRGEPKSEQLRRLWVRAGDLRRLLRRCLEAHVEGFHVVYGISGQPMNPFDLSHTRRLLSWDPQRLAEGPEPETEAVRIRPSATSTLPR